MKITFLGHAGFLVETRRAVLAIDPWLSPGGAFDGAWFQFPRNHHLAPVVAEALEDSGRERVLYLSHEHKDHFDEPFLRSLPVRDLTLLLPRFRRNALVESLEDLGARELIVAGDRERATIGDLEMRLFIEDSELSRDSALLVRAPGGTFLDLNDCKIFDALPGIAREEGAIDAFACQFSGATWHPTCYEYPPERYRAISRSKNRSKFETVARALESLKPRVYIPSAGPACFLDPDLFHLNFEEDSPFPRSDALRAYLEDRLPSSIAAWREMMPGDVLDVETASVEPLGSERVDALNVRAYLERYAEDYRPWWALRRRITEAGAREVLEALRSELALKLETFELAARVPVPLIFGLSDHPAEVVRVDFARGSVDVTDARLPPEHYRISAPSREVARVLAGRITWEDFSLTFRMRLGRAPDVYHTLLQGFLILEREDLAHFCARVLDLESKKERLVVEGGGRRYVVDRYCPHSGADLSTAWIEEGRFLTCPRHRWQFDLQSGGGCLTNKTSIRACALDDD
ncbi:MAG TPA: Rieske 2Fe-2S domain-containing protein [Candidatus Thermoplasmatota archaeon]|nr:Rieske 2Fe-2S domain-containing protein [Candidatus Thermoplasmatota archaeon]